MLGVVRFQWLIKKTRSSIAGQLNRITSVRQFHRLHLSFHFVVSVTPWGTSDLTEIQVQVDAMHVRSGKPGSVMTSNESPEKRSETSLLVKTTENEDWAVPFRRRAYMHFDLSLLSGQSIVDAKLQLHGTSTDIGFLSRTLDTQFAVDGLVDESLEEWSESS